jgi:hypothetical protein
MYCPTCGAEAIQGLNYCKRCGAGLSASTPPIEQASLGKAMGLMLFLVSLVSIAGFIALFSTIYSLGERDNFPPNTLVGIMAFGGVTVVGVIGLLVWLLLRLTTGQRQPAASSENAPNLARREYSVPQLPAQPIGIPSVTENTTRNFDPSVYREKGARE